MASVSTYLNFMGNTEEAFNFYKKAFQVEFDAPVSYMRDVPADSSEPEVSAEEKDKVMHISMTILGGHQIMGTDLLKSMGQELKLGNNMSIMLQPDTRDEADRIFAALSDGAQLDMPLKEMFWGDYFGSLTDKYGVQWMFNCTSKK